MYNTQILDKYSRSASCLKHMEGYDHLYFCFHRECVLILNLIEAGNKKRQRKHQVEWA